MATLTQGAAPNVVSANIYSEDRIVALSATLSPAAVAANTTAEQTFTVNGLATSATNGSVINDVILAINKPTAQAGLGIVGFRVSAANTLAVTFSNNTAGSITPTASEVYSIVAFRPAYLNTKTSFEG